MNEPDLPKELGIGNGADATKGMTIPEGPKSCLTDAPGTKIPPVESVNLNLDDPTPKREDYFEMWGLNQDEDYLIMASRNYVVWLDKNGDVDWRTTPQWDKKLDAEFKNGELSAVLNQVAELHSYPVRRLTDRKKRSFRVMIGEGLARAFEFDPKNAKEMLTKAGEYALTRNQELARIWYLGAATIATGFVAFFALVGWLLRDDINLIFGTEASRLGFLSCAGAFGSLFSIISRVGRADLDPASGRTLHLVEGCARIVIGVLGSAIVLLAMKVGLILSMLNEKGTSALLLVALVAGASERLVPTVIKQVESSAASKKESGSGK
jgi:hypothetical protein